MTETPTESAEVNEQIYKRRVRAWMLYDWANSAFATVILGAVLPIYYSQVAGATLPDETTATTYWSIGLSLSLFIGAIISPILGTVSDVLRGKKRFLSIFVGIGVVSTGLMVLIGYGDWMLASLLFVAGRLGFIGSITFYDSLLSHVARSDDQDRVSTMGYALGFLGGGLLLLICFGVIATQGLVIGARFAFIAVAIWWAVFSIPILTQVPEPPAATAQLQPGEAVLIVSLRRLRETFKDMQHYRELFKFLIAFLIYNDAIGTIINLATIYGAELGFGAAELFLALLLVTFAGVPFSIIFGRLTSDDAPRRAHYLAFVLFNAVMLPVVGILGRVILPGAISGIRQLAFPVINMAAGGGTVIALNATFSRQNNLLAILALMLALQLVGLIFAYLFGRRWFDALANRLDTQRGILLALAIYAVVAAWGFILDSTVEFWMLGLMIAMVQGGSMALSRSLFARLSPRAKSGEFFGLYGVMEKFASIVGPLVFVLAGFLFQNSRPALLLMVGFFFVGGWLLMRVDVEAGQRLARAKDEALLGATSDG